MNNKQTFIWGCIPARLLLVYIIYKTPIVYRKYISFVTLLISFGFFNKYIHSNKSDKGFFGNKVWWNKYRLFHSFMFLLFSILSFNNYSESWIVLLLDVLFGIVFYIIHYY
jgi:hypothetical protein